ncbi:hypothetical protein FKM82_022509 [Ascaphus truei]
MPRDIAVAGTVAALMVYGIVYYLMSFLLFINNADDNLRKRQVCGKHLESLMAAAAAIHCQKLHTHTCTHARTHTISQCTIVINKQT